MTLITAPQVLLSGAFGGRGWVRVEGDQIVGAGWGGPPDPPTIELPRGVLAPGLVDIQINGGYGHDFASADLAGWREVSARLPETGVTAYVPTIITATPQELITSIARYRQLRSEIDAGGARTLGLHCEGPFLAAGRPGAHREDLLLDPTTELVERLLDAADGAMAYLTLAPERAGALRAIRELVSAGVRVAVGHSDATDDEVFAAADAGATLITHLFNAQRGLHPWSDRADAPATCSGETLDGWHRVGSQQRECASCSRVTQDDRRRRRPLVSPITGLSSTAESRPRDRGAR
jgi:N-acetylglucosamine-6-phosphate deacetylase